MARGTLPCCPRLAADGAVPRDGALARAGAFTPHHALACSRSRIQWHVRCAACVHGAHTGSIFCCAGIARTTFAGGLPTVLGGRLQTWCAQFQRRAFIHVRVCNCTSLAQMRSRLLTHAPVTGRTYRCPSAIAFGSLQSGATHAAFNADAKWCASRRAQITAPHAMTSSVREKITGR